ncbi:MAG TPA: PQQ-binding-like beta-propeller repeat protein [Micavibrio sp.]
MNHFRIPTMAAFAALTLASCSGWHGDDKSPLPGERISVLEMQRNLEPDNAALNAQGFIAPEPWNNEFWPQNGGYPNHAMQNLALERHDLKKIWSADIGQGSQSRLPLVTQPVLADGRIFTIDTDKTLSAFAAATGKKLWEQDIAPIKEDDDPVIAGGIAYAQDRLYVTSGYSEFLVIDPGSGKIIWRKALPVPSRAAPTVMDNRLFIVTLDNRLMTFSTEDGSLLWEFSGLAETAGLLGAASPAASREIVVPAFSSGEIFALRVENGSVAWSDNLSGTRKIGNLATLSDIRGLPIMDKGMIFAISYGGKLVGIDERTGARVWQREIGGSETPWIAGNHLFVISTENDLVGIGRDTGVIRWVTPLPKFENPDKKKDPIVWTGPILAGNRLIVMGSNGIAMEIDPDTGKPLRNWETDGPVTISPVVAGGILYVLSDNGTLSAYK